jgi:hypothetical protein
MVMLHPKHSALSFPGKDHDEQFCCYFRQHWIRLWYHTMWWVLQMFSILVAGILSFAVLDLQETGSRRMIIAILGALFIFWNMEFLCSFYRYFLTVIIITDRKVHRIKKTLLAVDDHHSIDLWMLQDIVKRQHGVIQNMLKFGTLILEAQESQVRLHFTPRIQEHYALLMHLREKARNIAIQTQRSELLGEK